MEPGDSIIDGDNEWYLNTERRIEQASSQGLLYLGMGISGGEEGAQYSPSLMPNTILRWYTTELNMASGIAASWNMVSGIADIFAEWNRGELERPD